MGMPAPQIENVGTHSVTLIDLVIPLVIIDILAVEAIPQFIDLASDAKNGTLPLPPPLPHNIINTIGLSADHGLDHGLG
jgi:hypothetical protein